MTSPLSVLSPSKQNSRPSFISGSDSLKDTSPNSKLEISDEVEDAGSFAIYDENASPIKEGRTPSIRSENYLEDNDFDDEVPPSSPFQEAVNTEPTSLLERRTPRMPTSNEELEDEASASYEIDMGNNGPELNERRVSGVEEGDILDQPLDSTENHDNSEEEVQTDDSVIHHHVEQPQQRKVSSMTMLNEDMSIVEHRAQEQEAKLAYLARNEPSYGYDTGDDTCLSTFSAVTNADMTLFAKLRADSPLKRTREATVSPRKSYCPSRLRESSIVETPNSPRRSFRGSGWAEASGDQPMGSPTPRRKYPRLEGTPNLLDFTDEINGVSQQGYEGNFSPSRRMSRASPIKERYRSPTKLSLLDFDIPSAPTPRSIPTITPRELESLKSGFLSQISSLKATLSGKDAEVSSLKEAVTDAERRVGEALEDVRNEISRRETLESDQREWERRGKEMESVLRGVKAEIVDGEQERERLAKRAEEAEKGKEDLEGKIVELQSQLATARQAPAQPSSALASDGQLLSAEETAKEVQSAVEKVARELHTLYKGKHETKVAALKKSYEGRWEKRVRETEAKLKNSREEIERLQLELETAASSVGEATMIRETEGLEAEKRHLEAKIKGLEQELVSLKQDSETLRVELKAERAEKGELVAVVDEWLTMQQHQQASTTSPAAATPTDPPTSQQERPKEETISIPAPAKTPAPVRHQAPETVRPAAESNVPTSNIARPSGIRPRNTAGPTPKIPRFGLPTPTRAHTRGNSGENNIPTAAGGRTPGLARSGIMSSIERMGRGGAS